MRQPLIEKNPTEIQSRNEVVLEKMYANYDKFISNCLTEKARCVKFLIFAAKR